MAHRKATARLLCRRGSTKNDYVAMLLAPCKGVEDYLRVTNGVIAKSEILERWQSSPNVGRFRMVIGNRLRGEIKRERARLIAARRCA